jgi:hypothetical protein
MPDEPLQVFTPACTNLVHQELLVCYGSVVTVTMSVQQLPTISDGALELGYKAETNDARKEGGPCKMIFSPSSVVFKHDSPREMNVQITSYITAHCKQPKILYSLSGKSKNLYQLDHTEQVVL